MTLKRLISTILSLVWFLAMPGIGFADIYRSVSPYRDGFVAVSSGGMISLMDNDGETVGTIDTGAPGKLNAVSVFDGAIIVSGEKGFACSWDSTSSKVQKIKTGTQSSINALAVFGECLIGACDDGSVLTWTTPGKAPEKAKLEVKGRIVSLSADDKQCFGITELGEIISTKDGVTWTVFDFNSTYVGYYGNVKFRGISVGLGSIAAAGVYADSSRPAVFISSRGTVWSERGLSYSVGSDTFELNETPLSIHYDAKRDSFILACSDGVLFHIPGCSHCNRPEFLNSSDLFSIAFNGDAMLVAGANDFIIRF